MALSKQRSVWGRRQTKVTSLCVILHSVRERRCRDNKAQRTPQPHTTICYIYTRLRPRDKCTSTGIFTSLGEGEGGERREKRLIVAGPRDEWSGMMNRLHVMGGLLIMAILSVEIRCLSDVVLREGWEEQGSRGRAGISINLAAKWRVWHVVSVWRTQRDTSPLLLLSAHFDQCSQTLTINTSQWLVENVRAFGEWYIHFRLKEREAESDT